VLTAQIKSTVDIPKYYNKLIFQANSNTTEPLSNSDTANAVLEAEIHRSLPPHVQHPTLHNDCFILIWKRLTLQGHEILCQLALACYSTFGSYTRSFWTYHLAGLPIHSS
jgi:hypothetical protein